MVGRCMPVIRGLVAYPAGVAEMNIFKFMIFTTLGSVVWTALFVYLGYMLGDNLEVVNTWLHEFSIVVMIGIVAFILWHFRHHLRRLAQRRTRGE